MERSYIEVIVAKKYDNGVLASDTIGIIVGVVVAVVLIAIVAALVIFAKASGRLCFGDSDYNYNDARDGRKQPRSHSNDRNGGGGGYKDQQVHRFSNLCAANRLKIPFQSLQNICFTKRSKNDFANGSNA